MDGHTLGEKKTTITTRRFKVRKEASRSARRQGGGRGRRIYGTFVILGEIAHRHR